MNLITAIKNGLFRLRQRLVHTVVSTKIIGPTAQDLGLDSSKPIVYALQYKSHGQELVIDKVITDAGLPSILDTKKSLLMPVFLIRKLVSKKRILIHFSLAIKEQEHLFVNGERL